MNKPITIKPNSKAQEPRSPSMTPKANTVMCSHCNKPVTSSNMDTTHSTCGSNCY